MNTKTLVLQQVSSKQAHSILFLSKYVWWRKLFSVHKTIHFHCIFIHGLKCWKIKVLEYKFRSNQAIIHNSSTSLLLKSKGKIKTSICRLKKDKQIVLMKNYKRCSGFSCSIILSAKSKWKLTNYLRTLRQYKSTQAHMKSNPIKT